MLLFSGCLTAWLYFYGSIPLLWVYSTIQNFKWSSASAISFLVSLYALTLRTESRFVDEDRAYELKATLNLKHRAAEIIWGGVLLLFLGLTVKEQIDNAIDQTTSAVNSISSSMNGSGKQKKT